MIWGQVSKERGACLTITGMILGWQLHNSLFLLPLPVNCLYYILLFDYPVPLPVWTSYKHHPIDKLKWLMWRLVPEPCLMLWPTHGLRMEYWMRCESTSGHSPQMEVTYTYIEQAWISNCECSILQLQQWGPTRMGWLAIWMILQMSWYMLCIVQDIKYR